MEASLSTNLTLGSAAARPAIVLLHASGSSSRQWTDLAARLQPEFRVHAVDLHGHGMQPDWCGAAPLTLAHDARLVEPLLRDAGRVHLVGHSYGGAVALQLAATRPDAVASIVAYEPMTYHWLMDDTASDAARQAREAAPERQTPAQAALALAGVAHVAGEALLRDAPHEAGRAFVDFWNGTGGWQHMAQAHRDAVASRMRAVYQQFGAVFRAVFSRQQVARIPAPMLLMSGERTVPLGRHIAAQLRRALPRARHVVLPGMGHMGPVTHADAVNRRIAGFLRLQA